MIKVSDRDKGNISASILSASDVINKKIDSLSVKLNNLMSLLIEKNNDLGKMLVEVERLKGETKEICEDAADFTGTQTCPGYSYSGLIGKIKEIERELDGIDTDITIEDYCTGGYQDHIDNPDQGPGCTEFGVCNVYSIDGCDSYCQGYGEITCVDRFSEPDGGCVNHFNYDTGDTTGCAFTTCSASYGIPGVGTCLLNYSTGSCDIFVSIPGGGDGIQCKGMFKEDYEGVPEIGQGCAVNFETSDGTGYLSCEAHYSEIGDTTSCERFSSGESLCIGLFETNGSDGSCDSYCNSYGEEDGTITGEFCRQFGTSGGTASCLKTYQTGDGTSCKSSFEVDKDSGAFTCTSYGDSTGVDCTLVGTTGDGHITDCISFSEPGASCTGFKSESGGGGSCARGFKNADLECNSSFSYSGPGGTGMCDGFTDPNGHTTSGIIGGSCDRCYNNKYTYTDSSGNKVEVETKGDGTTTTTTTDSGGNTETEVTKPSGGAEAIIDGLCSGDFRGACNPYSKGCVGYQDGVPGSCLIVG